MSVNSQQKISSRSLYKIIECFCLDIDATKTAVLAGVSRRTVNNHFMRFRLAIFWYRTKRRREMVGGEVEVDESYHGTKRKRGFHGKLKRGRGTQKQPVFGIFERAGEVFTEVVPDCKKKTLQGLILGRISRDTVVYSDGWRGYNGLVDVGTTSTTGSIMATMNSLVLAVFTSMVLKASGHSRSVASEV